MFKKEYIGKDFFLRFLLMNVVMILLSTLFASFLMWLQIMFPIGEIMLFMMISVITISFYKKYNNEFFLKRPKVLNYSKRIMKINLFLLVLYYGLVFIFLFLG